MKRIYVAGPMSNPECIEYLENCRRMERVATWLLLAGYAPFCPSVDRLFFLQLRDGEKITGPMIKEYSMVYLRISDAVLVLEGWENSEGTKAEIKEAKRLSIPVFFNPHSLSVHFS